MRWKPPPPPIPPKRRKAESEQWGDEIVRVIRQHEKYCPRKQKIASITVHESGKVEVTEAPELLCCKLNRELVEKLSEYRAAAYEKEREEKWMRYNQRKR